VRELILLNQGWEYSPRWRDEFIQPEVKAEGFVRVNLPHANKEIPYNYFDEKDYQFVSCYRRTFAYEERWAGKRVFADFDGVMAYGEVYLNGKLLASHKGGYTPFAVDLTSELQRGENVLVVKVDSTERPDIPPFGYTIDYLCYGGIYRDVFLRIVDPVFIENIFAKPQKVLEEKKALETTVFLNNTTAEEQILTVTVKLKKDGKPIAEQSQTAVVKPGKGSLNLVLSDLAGIELWDIDHPHLYQVEVEIADGQGIRDNYTTRMGFREAAVKPDGFYLNGKKVMIRGLNRHQAFPYVGYAMPARVQRRDADILKFELSLNAVRTSHYPQSPHFLDRCDEIGLLVFEEIPGWQHIGDKDWQAVACENVREMIQRDWNHPSIFLWGVRINESQDCHGFYKETNRIARELDPTRQTAGVRYIENSEFLEDVYTMNDFIHSGGEQILRDPKPVTKTKEYVPYMVTEFNGHMFPTKRFDQEERLVEHALRHLRVQNQAALDPHISGAFGWCAFDYNTHYDFGSGDRICYHGVMDMFRIPKFAAHFYGSQVDPRSKPVLEPATRWTWGDRSIGGVLPLVIFTNCDKVKIKLHGHEIGEFYPSKARYPGVPYPPVVIDKVEVGDWGVQWFEGEFIGIVDGEEVIVRRFTPASVPTKLVIQPDDLELKADGMDATRVVFMVVDQMGNPLPYLNDAIEFQLEGPGTIIGPTKTALIGGAIATWVRTTEEAGTIRLKGVTTRLKSETIEIKVRK
jgi:beta-galactosidase